MRRTHISHVLIAIFSLLAVPAWAEGAGAKEKKPEPGTTQEMPFLAAPMSQDGKLLGYTYIQSKLVCTSPEACASVRLKIPFIQDANVRDVNAKPIGLPDDPRAVDKEQLNARLTANARRIVGANKIAHMLFLDMKFSPLHPGETTDGPAVAPPEAAQPQTGAQPQEATAGAKPTTDNAVHSDATSKPGTKSP